MPRAIAIAIGVIYVVGAVLLFTVIHALAWGAIYLLINGVVVLGALAFERRRYRPVVDTTRGQWQLTGERFVDPTSGRTMNVRYNPATGERDYVDVDGQATESSRPLAADSRQ